LANRAANIITDIAAAFPDGLGALARTLAKFIANVLTAFTEVTAHFAQLFAYEFKTFAEAVTVGFPEAVAAVAYFSADEASSIPDRRADGHDARLDVAIDYRYALSSGPAAWTDSSVDGVDALADHSADPGHAFAVEGAAPVETLADLLAEGSAAPVQTFE